MANTAGLLSSFQLVPQPQRLCSCHLFLLQTRGVLLGLLVADLRFGISGLRDAAGTLVVVIRNPKNKRYMGRNQFVLITNRTMARWAA